MANDTQAQFLIPMAVSMATGIIFASVVILFLVPALVSIREGWRTLIPAFVGAKRAGSSATGRRKRPPRRAERGRR